MPKGPKLTLLLSRSRSTQGHDLYEHCSTTDPDATYQVSRQLAPVVLEKKIFKVLSIFSMAAILVLWPWPFDCH